MKAKSICTEFLVAFLLLANHSGTVLSARASGVSFQPNALAGTQITVTTTTDELNSDGDCSLREAIRAANTNLAVDACAAGSATMTDTVTLQNAVTYSLSLVGTDDTATAGDLDITDDLIIRGSSATVQAGTTSSNGIDRVFQIITGNTVSISNLTIRHGRTTSFGAGIRTAGTLTLVDCTITTNNSTGNAGGGIAEEAGTLTLIGTTVSSNSASTLGGGIALLGGTATLVDSAVTSNNAMSDRGGGIWIGTTATTTLIYSAVSSNDADTNGGGIYNENNLTMTSSTINNNQAGIAGGGSSEAGGGIYNKDSLTISHSTIRNNTADDGAGIVNSGGVMSISRSTINNNVAISAAGIRNTLTATANLVNTTVSSNSASAGAGGIANGSGSNLNLSNVTIAFNTADSDASSFGDGGGLSNSATATVRNSIIGENIDASPSGTIFPDCSGGFTSAGYNLIENTTGCAIGGVTTGNITGIDPNLSALATNGGRTQTNAFPTGSPPHNAGNPAGCVDHLANPITSDQRDGARLDRCDQGAFEFAACLVIGDVDDDSDVDSTDLTLVGNAWSSRLAHNAALDIVVDGLINANDLQAVAARFGLMCN